MIVRSDTVGNREDLAKIANLKGLMTAVEIGTDRGTFAADFLNRWLGEMLWCVDVWEPVAEMPWDRQGDLLTAVMTLAPHSRRTRLMRATSVQAAKYFRDIPSLPKELGIVYIDGAHDYISVRGDIELWWPLVKVGGILAGDDFHESTSGVIQAVTEFSERHNLRVDLTTDYNRSPSWYIEKHHDH